MKLDWTGFDDFIFRLANEPSLPERKNVCKKLKRRLNEFSPEYAETLLTVLNCKDYEQRNAMIDVQREKARAEMDKQYEIQKQYSTKSIEYQRARARYVELDKILDFLSDCRNI